MHFNVALVQLLLKYYNKQRHIVYILKRAVLRYQILSPANEALFQ